MAEGGTLTYMLILHQLLPVFLTNIAAEKESKIKELMKMTGLKFSIYWFVHYLFNYLLYLLVTSCLMAAGGIYQVRFYTINDFGSYIILFLVWGHVLVAFVSNIDNNILLTSLSVVLPFSILQF